MEGLERKRLESEGLKVLIFPGFFYSKLEFFADFLEREAEQL
jgi:hypothetical protein